MEGEEREIEKTRNENFFCSLDVLNFCHEIHCSFIAVVSADGIDSGDEDREPSVERNTGI